MNDFFSGNKLYGDDFSIEEISQWYDTEAEGYANLGSKDRSKYKYPYHNMNIYFGFNYLPKEIRFNNVLGLGSAYGDEFLPILNRIDAITILEPSDQLNVLKIGNITPNYSKPEINGKINFENEVFDLIICFGVLHHIPNVSYVLSELARVTKRNGYILLKEPIHTMGDWNKPRRGLTKNERGISLNYFRNILAKNNLKIVKESLCDCAFLYRLFGKVVKRASHLFQRLDRFFSKLFKWNYHYHRKINFQKIAPSAVFYVLKK